MNHGEINENMNICYDFSKLEQDAYVNNKINVIFNISYVIQ